MRRPPPNIRFDDPMWFLAYHSMELYLKAYLRHDGASLGELRKAGHGLSKLWDAATSAGLTCLLDPRQMLQTLDSGELLSLRYIKTGFVSRPHPEQLMEFLDQLRTAVFATLNQAGLPVRFEGRP